MQAALDHDGLSRTKEKGRQYERELRRSRGEISCLECRRMKIKCDRKVPCSSCVKRNCVDKCPNGSTKTTTADYRKLQLELERERERVRELEKALQLAHTSGTNSTHTLLSLAQAQTSSLASPTSSNDNLTSSDQDQGISEVFGTLSIADSGESVFHGPSAVSENLMLSNFRPRTMEDVLPKIPAVLNELVGMWPFMNAAVSRDTIYTMIEAQLPSFERASALCEAYLQNLSWFNLSMSRAHLMEELIPLIYHRKPRPDGSLNKVDVRDLALLFSVFACGAAGDLTQKANNNEARQYYYLARATLSLGAGLCRGCLQALLTMSLLGLYHLFACPTDDPEEAWRMHSMAISNASTLGLHRDPGRWKLSAQMQDQRRRVFWGMCLLDYQRALSSGRPPIINMDSVDVEYPHGVTSSFSVDGAPYNGYYFWSLEFLRRCLAPVVQRFCANPKPVRLCEVMEYDKKIREYETERSVWQQKETEKQPVDSTDSVCVIKHMFASQNSDILLLSVHRNFFARTVLDYPDDPLRSPFAPSFLTALRLAISAIQRLQEAIEINLPWILRIWPIWSHALNSAVIVGSIASRCPSCDFAPTAFSALESAIASFRKAKEHPIASRGLPILERLREKALRASFNSGGTQDSTPDLSDEDEENDIELNVLRGSLRLVSHKTDDNQNLKNTVPVLNGQRNISDLPFSYASELTYGSAPSSEIVVSPGGVNDDWATNIDAVMANYQQLDYFSMPTAGLAAEADSFASLEPDMFTNTDPNTHILHSEPTGIATDMWGACNFNINDQRPSWSR